MKKYILLLLLFFTVTLLSACSNSPVNPNKKPDTSSKTNESEITYKNDKYGFTMTLPSSWKDKYCVTEAENKIIIRHKDTFIKSKAGALFTITVFTPKDKWETEGKALQEAVGMQKLFEDDSTVYGFSTPTDVQYIPNDKKLCDEYNLMESNVSTIIKSFKK